MKEKYRNQEQKNKWTFLDYTMYCVTECINIIKHVARNDAKMNFLRDHEISNNSVIYVRKIHKKIKDFLHS
jgi:hypothetical protein